MMTNYTKIPGGQSIEMPIKVLVTGLYESLFENSFLFKNTEAPIGSELLRPWVEIFQYGKNNGIDFLTNDSLKENEIIDAIICIDRPLDQNIVANHYLERDILKILILYETEMIHSPNWDMSYHKRYDMIFTWNDEFVDNLRYFKCFFPGNLEPNFHVDEMRKNGSHKKLCTMVASGKLINHPNELYSERIKIIQWFDDHHPEDFELYGVGWPENYFKTYKGRVIDKIATLSNFKFSICFENAKDYEGYISEKIIDCLKSGVIPIYFGAPNIVDWIPSSCYINYTEFDSIDSLYSFMKNMTESIYLNYLSSIDSFLKSPDSYPFSIDFFITQLTGHLTRKVKCKRNSQPLISISIPTYNYGKFLPTAINSVIESNIQNYEIIIIDNCSDDNTEEIASHFTSQYSNIKYFRQSKNVGAFHNWNSCAAISSGTFLIFLSADDFLLAGHLERSLQSLLLHNNAGLAYCPIIYVDETNKPKNILTHPGHPKVDYAGGRNEAIDLLINDCYITPSTAIIKRDAFDKAGGFRHGLKAAIDFDLWIRIFLAGFDFIFFRVPMVCYRIHPNQDTNRAVISGDMFADHVNILEYIIHKHGITLLAGYTNALADILKNKITSHLQYSKKYNIDRANKIIYLLENGGDIDSKTS
jgi:glycosyltransferase involved in cell wall biosynthesis